MSRYENVLIDANLSLPEMAARVGEIVGTPPERLANPYDVESWLLDLSDETGAFLEVADLEDEPQAPFSRYRYLIEVQTVRDGHRDFPAAERAARRLYDRLAAATDWPLLLAFDDGQRFVASRDAPAAA